MRAGFNTNQMFAIKWLAPVIALVREHQFNEAIVLANYYPLTPGRQLAQIAALLGQYAGNLKTSKSPESILLQAELIARAVKVEDREDPADFAQLVNEISFSLLETVFWAGLKSGWSQLAHLCLEAIHTSKSADSEEQAIGWLELAFKSNSQLSEFALKRLFTLAYDPRVVMQRFSENRSYAVRQQLLTLLQGRAWRLSNERATDLIAELLKTNLQLYKSQSESLQQLSETAPPHLAVRIKAGLVRQQIFALPPAGDLKKAADRIAMTSKAIERLAHRQIDPEQLVRQADELADMVTPSAKRDGLYRLKPQVDELVQMLEPYLYELNAVQALLNDLQNLLHVSYSARSQVDLHLEADKLNRLTGYHSGQIEQLPMVARAIRTIHASLLARLPDELSTLGQSLTTTSTRLAVFIEQSNQMLEDPFSYTLALNQLEEIRRQKEAAVDQVVSLSKSWAENGFSRLRPESPRVAYNLDPSESMLAYRENDSGEYYRPSFGELPSPAPTMPSAAFDMPSAAPATPQAERVTTQTSAAKQAKMPTQTVERYTRILFPLLCKLNERVQLRIQLTKRIPTVTRILKKLRLQIGLDVEVVQLTVIVTAPGFAIRPAQQQLVMRIDQDSNEVVFDLFAAEEGEQVVEIEFFYESKRVGHALVHTHVGVLSGGDDGKNVALLKDPLKSIDTKPAVQAQLLHVTWLEKAGEISYTLPGIDDGKEWKQTAPQLKTDVQDSLRELNAFLTEAVTDGAVTEEVWESTLLNLKGKGKSLFDSLVPYDLASRMREWNKDTNLSISTNEQWIPWELMFDGEEFLGRKHILTRCPRPDDYKKWPERPVEHGDSHVIEKIVNVIGGGLHERYSTRAGKLFDSVISRALVAPLREKAVFYLNREVATADVLHCTCHGLLSPHLLRIAKDTSRTQNLSPETVKVMPLQAGSLVFANACSSAGVAVLFGSFNSFGWEFYLRGASVFVGTLGAVPTNYAIEYAENVYAPLFDSNGPITIGQALAKARKKAEKKHNIFWLLYCIYGDPDYSVQFRNAPIGKG